MRQIAIIFLTLVAAIAQADDKQDQAKFITDFYRGLLDAKSQSAYQKKTPFFSKEMLSAMKENDETCRKRSRGDDMCGYESGGDLFLNAQETDPKLKFDTSGFKAVAVDKDRVEATFTVWPGQGDYYQRKLIFKLVKEGKSWRADDVLYPSSFYNVPEGKEPSSLRNQIAAETAGVRKEAKDLNAGWFWIRNYIKDKDMLDRAERWVSDPVEICRPKCKLVKKGKERKAALADLNSVYGGEKGKPFPGDDDFGKKESVEPKTKDRVVLEPFTFEFKDDMWWIAKIDFTKVK